jgi:hypothetical protein
VNGFLQVQATMTMALTRLTLRPIELHAVLRTLFAEKARTSPKAVRFELVPGRRVRIVLEPWEQTIELTSTYTGEREQVIRIWGRERLKLLSRLLPLATSVRVELAGFSLPSFWVVDLGGLSYTLGLSGWTDKDWTGANLQALGLGEGSARRTGAAAAARRRRRRDHQRVLHLQAPQRARAHQGPLRAHPRPAPRPHGALVMKRAGMSLTSNERSGQPGMRRRQAKRDGLAAQRRPGPDGTWPSVASFAAMLRGQIAWVQMVDRDKGGHLRQALDALAMHGGAANV